MTTFGIVFLPVVAIAVLRWRATLPWMMALALVAPATAVIIVGGIALTPFAIVCLVTVPFALGDMVKHRADLFGWPGGRTLLFFTVWASFITLAGPVFFRGIRVLGTEGGVDQQMLAPSLLAHTQSNVAQLAYFVLAAVLIVWVAQRDSVPVHPVGVALGLVLAISLWRLLSDLNGLPFPAEFFDNNTTIKYIDGTPTGAYRLRGVLPEPSGLALYGLTAAIFGAAMSVRTRGWMRIGYGAMAAAALIVLYFTRSGTSLAAGGAILACAGIVVLFRLIANRRSTVIPIMTLLLTATVALPFLPDVWSYVDTFVGNKVESSSFDNRTGADRFSLGVALETYGLGAGVGSNRPSSMMAMLISCVGVPGTAAYLFMVARLVLHVGRSSRTEPLAWALAAAVVTKSVTAPLLADPLLTTLLAFCACAAAAALREPASDATVSSARPAHPRARPPVEMR